MAFVVEIALANARKDDSEIQIKNKQDLLFVLTDRNIFVKVLKQADNTKYRIPRGIAAEQNYNYIVNYFMRVKDEINMEE
jgi:hypothetical protein